MDTLLDTCMYIAVHHTPPESATKDRAHLARSAASYHGPGVENTVWLAVLDRLVSVGDVIRTPRGYLPAPGSAERYRGLGYVLIRIGNTAAYLQDT